MVVPPSPSLPLSARLPARLATLDLHPVFAVVHLLYRVQRKQQAGAALGAAAMDVRGVESHHRRRDGGRGVGCQSGPATKDQHRGAWRKYPRLELSTAKKQYLKYELQYNILA